MSSQQPINSAATQPSADPRRPRPNSGVAPPRAKLPQGAKPVARPAAPRKNLKASTPAKPTKKKSESWIDSIKSALSCCSSRKKSPVHVKGKPVAKHPAKPGVKAVPGAKPGVKAVPSRHAAPRSDTSVRPSRKVMAQARAKSKLAPRGKTREPLPSESRSGSKSRSKEGGKKSSRSKEHHRRSKSKEQPTGDSQKVVISGKKSATKENAKPESKDYINSKRSKEPVVDTGLKTAEFWNEDEVSKTDREDKKKKRQKEKKKEVAVSDPAKPVQSLYINRFLTEGRQVFRWTYEESFPEGQKPKGMAKLFEHRPREIDRHKPVVSEVCKKAKEPQSPKSQPTPTYDPSVSAVKDETPKRKKKEENYFDPQEVLRKTKKIENYVDPQQVLCCFCCDCEGNQELRKNKKCEIKL